MEAKGKTLSVRTLRILAATAGLVLVSAHAEAQGAWTVTATTGPSARSGHAMAFDTVNNRVVLFGGGPTSGGLSAETWAYSAGTWTLIATSGPSPRRDHAMVFDSVRGRMVLFGGNDGAPRGDTWELVGNTWVPMIFASGPYPRHAHAMAFDSVRGRTVMFGGHLHGLIETWEWDGTQWSPYWGPGPGGRDSHVMAFDSQRGQTVLYGGNIGTVFGIFLSDTWHWDGATWTQVAGGGPPATSGSAMAFDGQRAFCVLVGGWNGTLNGQDWEWDGTSWTPGSRTAPFTNSEHAIAFDSQRGRMVAFGGAWNPTSETRELVFTIGGGSTYGTGCGAPALSLQSDPAMPPSINSLARATVQNMPTSVGAVMIGWSNTQFGAFGAFSLPVSLASLGMPGCDLLQSADLFGLPVAPTGVGVGEFLFTVPNQPAAVGVHLYLQALAYAPAANPGGFVVSNGLDWTVGP